MDSSPDRSLSPRKNRKLRKSDSHQPTARQLDKSAQYSSSDSLPSKKSKSASWGSLKKRSFSVSGGPPKRRAETGTSTTKSNQDRGNEKSSDSPPVCGMSRSQWLELDYEALLHSIFSDQQMSHKFTTFLEQKRASENYQFFCHCVLFEKTESAEDRKQVAANIIKKFISNEADYPVNLEDSMKKNLLKHYQDPPRDLFNVSVRHVQGMLKQYLTEFKFQVSSHI